MAASGQVLAISISRGVKNFGLVSILRPKPLSGHTCVASVTELPA